MLEIISLTNFICEDKLLFQASSRDKVVCTTSKEINAGLATIEVDVISIVVDLKAGGIDISHDFKKFSLFDFLFHLG